MRWLLRQRQFVVGLVAGALLAAGVVAAVRALTGGGDAPEPGPLTIMSGRDDSANGQRQALIEQWNRMYPANPAKIVELPRQADAQHSEMVTQAQSGRDDVDVFNLDVTWTAEFADAGYVRRLDPSTVDLS